MVETIIANAGEAYAVIKEREVGELLMGKMFGNILVSDDINACAKFLDLDVVKALISEKESDMISWAMSTCSYTLSAQTTRMLTERDIPLVGVRSFTPGVLRGSIDLVAYELSIHREEYTLGPRVYLAILGAVLKGHVDMVQYLLQIFDLSLEGFADIVVSLGCGTSLLTASIDSGSVGMVRLVKGSEVCAKTDVLRYENFARSLRNERAARFESRSSFREWHAVEYYPTFGGKYTVRKAVAPQWKVERALKVAQGA